MVPLMLITTERLRNLRDESDFVARMAWSLICLRSHLDPAYNQE